MPAVARSLRSSTWHPGYSWNFPSCKLLHVDIDPAELGRNYPPTLGLIADAKVPCVWVVWNNFAWSAIRDLQHGLFDGREIGTGIYRGKQGPGGERYNPDFAAWARACGADEITVTRSEDLRGAVEQAVRDRRAH